MTFFWILAASITGALMGWYFGFNAGKLETKKTEKENEL